MTPELPAEACAALRDALESHLAGRTPDGALAQALGEFADTARGLALPGERVLIELKRVWAELPSVTDARSAEERQRLLQRIVSLSIKHYYAPPTTDT